MMSLRLAVRDVRALVLGGSVLAVFIGLPGGVRAWLTWRAQAMQAAAEMTHELERSRATIAGLGTALDSAEARVARFREVGTMMYVAKKPAEAAAALTAVIREAAGSATIRIISMESRVDTASVSPLRRVVATVHANGDVTGLATLLQLVEGRRTLHAVRELYVQPNSVETPQHAAEVLDIRFMVEALAVIAADERQP